MNRVRCNECGEHMFSSPLTAEALEGLGYRCPHCNSFGRINLRENDEGELVALELVAIHEDAP